jgi:hypothetical protein
MCLLWLKRLYQRLFGHKKHDRPKKGGYSQNYLVFYKFFFTFDPTNQIFLPVGCLVFIKKGGEIRL